MTAAPSRPSDLALALALGLAVYAAALRVLGFTHVERRLAATLFERYRSVLRR